MWYTLFYNIINLYVIYQYICYLASSAPIHALLDLFITRQVHAIAKRITFRIQPPAPLPKPAPQGPSVVGCESWGSSLPPTASAHAASPRATQRCIPSERWSAPDYVRQEETSCIPPWARAPCIRWLSRWRSCWAPGSWRPSFRSRVPACRCQGWKVAECFPPCCRLQHDANTDSFRHKSLLRKLNLIKKILLLKEILSDGAGNTRPNWNAWLLQTNLISTVLNTKLWNRPCGCTIEGPPCFNAEGPDTALLDLPLPEPGAKGRITVQEAAEVSLTNIERVISYVK